MWLLGATAWGPWQQQSWDRGHRGWLPRDIYRSVCFGAGLLAHCGVHIAVRKRE